MNVVSSLEKHFASFAVNVIGQDQSFDTPYGKKKMLYADWTASGRCYGPIEECLKKQILPFVGNTHTSTTITGSLMSSAYQEAKSIIKTHVHACQDDVLVFCGSGTTHAVNKLQRILGLRLPERIADYRKKNEKSPEIDEARRPVVFISHMEHHSNQTSWLETIATVEVVAPDASGNMDLAALELLFEKYKKRRYKIVAITACSNVTGVTTPVNEIAKVIHSYHGYCFVDFACSAPYVQIDMHPKETGAELDAIYFSPHKFLGGPGTPGVLIFNKKLYRNEVPDQPGGGTLVYSNPWKEHTYVVDIEQREDGGTPPFLGAIKAAMCVRLKEKMGIKNMQVREKEMLAFIFYHFSLLKNVRVFEADQINRLGVISFIVEQCHYLLFVKLLNDRFGIQARGGCSCAGTYGHKLLHLSRETSADILRAITAGDLSCKPGWVRISIHPVMSDDSIKALMHGIRETANNFSDWGQHYHYDKVSGEYVFKHDQINESGRIKDWFTI